MFVYTDNISVIPKKLINNNNIGGLWEVNWWAGGIRWRLFTIYLLVSFELKKFLNVYLFFLLKLFLMRKTRWLWSHDYVVMTNKIVFFLNPKRRNKRIVHK